MKEKKPDCILLGEAWDDLGSDENNALFLKSYSLHEGKPLFSSLFHFPLQSAIRSLLVDKKISLTSFANALFLAQSLKTEWFCPTAFLDNHDMPRLLFLARGRQKTLRSALDILYALPFHLMVEYGTEVGLSGDSKIPQRHECGRLAMHFPESRKSSASRLSSHLVHLADARQKLGLDRAVMRPLIVQDGVLVIHCQGRAEVLLVILLHDGFCTMDGMKDWISKKTFSAGSPMKAGVYWLSSRRKRSSTPRR